MKLTAHIAYYQHCCCCFFQILCSILIAPPLLNLHNMRTYFFIIIWVIKVYVVYLLLYTQGHICVTSHMHTSINQKNCEQPYKMLTNDGALNTLITQTMAAEKPIISGVFFLFVINTCLTLQKILYVTVNALTT